jgi:predicted transcriptional regulator
MPDENLFDYAARAPHSNESTSKEAARSVEKDVSRIARLVLGEIKARPSTCDEVERATGLSHQTVSARIRALVLDGMIEDSREKRPTRSGRRAIVWAAR